MVLGWPSFLRDNAALAQDANQAPIDFERQIVPILVRNCLDCHGPSEPASGLDLTAREHALASADSGATAIVPGSEEESLLIHQVTSRAMPPEKSGRRLTDEEITLLRGWVRQGADWPEDRTLSPYEFTTDRRAGLDWWSLAAPVRAPLPPVRDAAWPRHALDQFILARLEQAGLAPAPEADRATYIRRVTYDLLGLPPTPEEIRDFVTDESPGAHEKLVDRLLASPHYGERFARLWLDVARFGESNGYETNTARANAWPYRDYVINAFNQDLPYTRFILEQLAGDQVGADVATGFLVGGTHDEVGIKNIEGQLQQRVNDLDDMLSTTAGAFLGVTLGCAKCHDHKFDPVRQVDYYAMQAVFAGVQHGTRMVKLPNYDEFLRTEPETRRELAQVEARRQQLLTDGEPLATVEQPPDGNREPGPRRPVNVLLNNDRFTPVRARYVRFTVLATTSAEPCLDELEVFSVDAPRNVALASAGAKATASSVYAQGGLPIHQIAHLNDGQYGNGRSWISAEPGQGWAQIELADVTTIDRVAWARDREGRYADRLATRYKIEVATELDQWQVVASDQDRQPHDAAAPGQAPDPTARMSPEQAQEYRELEARRQALAARLPAAAQFPVYAGTFATAPATHRLHRGEPMQPKEQVPPGSIACFGRPWQLSADAPEVDRRLALARWIGDAEHPRTSRVMVNRIWQRHFGRGLADSPGDLGWHGARPSHPELLDWLACEYVALGWSAKALDRAIVLSATYRQSSPMNEQAHAIDAGNRLLWRMAPRRCQAEELRDAMLFVSGALDPRLGGPGYDAFEPNTNYVKVYIPKNMFGPAEWRRMLYQAKPRMVQDATFGAFDCPDASRAVHRRNVSTTALQALNLLNSPFVVQQAERFADRLSREATCGAAAQVRRGFWLALGREPDESELTASTQLVEQYGLVSFCRVLFNASEFVFVP